MRLESHYFRFPGNQKFQKRQHEIEELARNISSSDIEREIVVIAPNIDDYEALIERIFPRHFIQPPFMARKKLAEFPIVKTCLSLFDIIAGNFGRKAVVSFLLSPFICFLKDDERSVVDRKTRQAIIASGDDWKQFLNEKSVLGHVAQLIYELTSLRKKRGLEFLSHYVSFLKKVLVYESNDDIDGWIHCSECH